MTKRYNVKKSPGRSNRWNIYYGDLVVDYRSTWQDAFKVAFRRATVKRLV